MPSNGILLTSLFRLSHPNRYFRTAFPENPKAIAFQNVASDLDRVKVSFMGMPDKIVKPALLKWAGWKPVEGGGMVYDESSQKFFTPLEIKALFSSEEDKGMKNNWLTEIRGVPVTLELYNKLGCRWEIDCGGKRPGGVRIQWDPMTGRVQESSEVVEYVSMAQVANYLGIGKKSEVAKTTEEGAAEQLESSEKPAEGEEEMEESDPDWKVEKKETGGDADLVFLRVYEDANPMRRVVPGDDLIARGLGMAKGLGDVAFDLEKGGVDLVVFIVKPEKREWKEAAEPGGKPEEIEWMPDEEWVRGMCRLAAGVLAKDSVLVAVAPVAMPAEWMEGLKELDSAWTFGVLCKVGVQSNLVYRSEQSLHDKDRKLEILLL